MGERIAAAEESLRFGAPPAVAAKRLIDERGLSRGQAALVVERALILLGEEFTKLIPHYKVLQVHRLHSQIAAAMGAQKMGDAMRGEAILSQIIGTRAPTRVEVGGDDAVRAAISTVAASLSAAERDKLIEEQLELERAASRTMNGHANGAGHG